MLRRTSHDYIYSRFCTWNYIRGGRADMYGDHVRQAPPQTMRKVVELNERGHF